MEHPNLKYIRGKKLPHMFCGELLNCLLFAIDELKLDMSKMVAIGGVGCSSRIPAYLDMYAIHGIHGRNLAYATGVRVRFSHQRLTSGSCSRYWWLANRVNSLFANRTHS